MTRTHLHFEAGGDPSQRPAADLTNATPAPHDGNEFPDVPDANRPGPPAGRHGSAVPDQPDLDAFADRLGIERADDDTADDDSPRRDAGPSSPTAPSRTANLLAVGLEGAARVLRSSASALDRLRSRLRR